jgi:ABC-type Na+ efflux pump permease subunit
VYYQGKTLANLTLWLMNVKSKHFTMRHLIMGLGRVQKAKYVKICGPGREKMLLVAAQEAFDVYEKRAQDEIKEAAEAAGAALSIARAELVSVRAAKEAAEKEAAEQRAEAERINGLATSKLTAAREAKEAAEKESESLRSSLVHYQHPRHFHPPQH